MMLTYDWLIMRLIYKCLVVNKNISMGSLRVVETFKRKSVGQTDPFRIII